jgi:Concanavalin A-like lectin/glucanases superfamily
MGTNMEGRSSVPIRERGTVMEREHWSRREFLAVTGTAGLAALGVTTRLDAAAASNYKKKVLAKKPVAYWRLGEARGPNALDSTGHGHKGTYHGAPAFGQPGAIKGDTNTAINLDGNHSYVEIPSHKDFSQPTSGKGLTVEVWFRPDVLVFQGETGDTRNPYIHWLAKGGPGQREWALRLYSRDAKDFPNRISAYIFNPAGDLGAGAHSVGTLTTGHWIHVVACFDPGNADTRGNPGVRLYKNGSLQQGPPARGTRYNNPPDWQIRPRRGTSPLRLGTRDVKRFFTGGLDEVAIYPRVLTPEEIRENYHAGKSR